MWRVPAGTGRLQIRTVSYNAASRVGEFLARGSRFLPSRLETCLKQIVVSPFGRKVRAVAEKDPTQETAPSSREAISWRWWVALALVCVGVLIFALSRAEEGWRICEEVLATTGADATTSVCRPVSALDLAVILLPVAILLFPDVAELAIPGLISLKRDVAEQRNKQASLERSLLLVEQRVSQVQNVNILNYPPEWLAQLAQKEAAFRKGGSDG